MAPAAGLAHAATALSLLALGLNVETRLRSGGLLTAQLSEPEPGLTLESLQDKLGQMEGTVAGQQAFVAQLGARTARCEALLEPLAERKPGQSAPDAMNLTNRSIGNNATIIAPTAAGLARPKLRWEDVLRNAAGMDFLKRINQMQIEIDAIKKVTQGSSAPDAGHSEVHEERRRAQANGGGAGADAATSAPDAARQSARASAV